MSGPVCIEWNGGLCGAPATHEVRLASVDPTWGAKCSKCVRFYNPRQCEIRELTPTTSDSHELAQYRAGTLPRSR